MSVHDVLDVDAVPDGGHAVVTVEGKSIGIYRLGDSFYAINNYCPHQGAPMCAGLVSGTTLPSGVYEYEYGKAGEIIRCPWHGWEFDIRTGKSLFSEKIWVKTYKVIVEDGRVHVDMDRK